MLFDLRQGLKYRHANRNWERVILHPFFIFNEAMDSKLYVHDQYFLSFG
jgi:hypothetical protein